MTTSDTPETDALIEMRGNSKWPPGAATLCRKLERERDLARQELANAREDRSTWEKIAIGGELRRTRAERERDNALRERDAARRREAKWKAVARALYYAVGSDMEAKADQAFTALRSEVEG